MVYIGLLYDFTRLIKKYSNEAEVIKVLEGRYVNGRYVNGETVTKKIIGAVIPLKDSKIYQSGGTLTASDRQMYTLEALGEDLNNVKVFYHNKHYKVEEDTDYSDYANVHVYVLKRIDSFDKSN